MEIKYAREVVYTLISAEFIITVLIDGDTFEYVRALGDPRRLSRIGRERTGKKNCPQPLFLLEIRDLWHAVAPRDERSKVPTISLNIINQVERVT